METPEANEATGVERAIRIAEAAWARALGSGIGPGGCSGGGPGCYKAVEQAARQRADREAARQAERKLFSETCDARALPLVGCRSESVRKGGSPGGVVWG